MPIYEKELQTEYMASFVAVFLGANDAVLEHGPDKAQFVSLQDYRANLQRILHTVRPLLAPHGQVLLITPPCVIDSARHGDRSNASAASYAKTCVELAKAENVHVLDLHTYFNTTFPMRVSARRTSSTGCTSRRRATRRSASCWASPSTACSTKRTSTASTSGSYRTGTTWCRTKEIEREREEIGWIYKPLKHGAA